MCFGKVPSIDQETKDAQAQARAAEQQRQRDLKEKALERQKSRLGDTGIRSLIGTSRGSGFGRNFFS